MKTVNEILDAIKQAITDDNKFIVEAAKRAQARVENLSHTEAVAAIMTALDPAKLDDTETIEHVTQLVLDQSYIYSEGEFYNEKEQKDHYLENWMSSEV